MFGVRPIDPIIAVGARVVVRLATTLSLGVATCARLSSAAVSVPASGEADYLPPPRKSDEEILDTYLSMAGAMQACTPRLRGRYGDVLVSIKLSAEDSEIRRVGEHRLCFKQLDQR